MFSSRNKKDIYLIPLFSRPMVVVVFGVFFVIISQKHSKLPQFLPYLVFSLIRVPDSVNWVLDVPF